MWHAESWTALGLNNERSSYQYDEEPEGHPQCQKRGTPMWDHPATVTGTARMMPAMTLLQTESCQTLRNLSPMLRLYADPWAFAIRTFSIALLYDSVFRAF